MAATLVGAMSLIACGADDNGPALTVDGVEISHEQFAALHTDVDGLDDDERAGNALLLVLRAALVSSAAADLDVELSNQAVESALAEKLAAVEARGDIDEELAAQNQTRERLRIEAELDTLRTDVGAALVRTEADGFDLDAAYLQYSLANAEVCIKQMQLTEEAAFDVAVERLDAGEDFGLL